MSNLKILVHGATGKMGISVLSAVNNQPDMDISGAVAKQPRENLFTIPGSSNSLHISTDLETSINKSHPDVMVDFTNSDACMTAIRIAAPLGVNLVIGSTGFTEENLSEIESLTHDNQISTFIASNFAIGAVLIMHISKLVGKFFEYADIVEMHHEAKIDSPSGTALSIARNLSLGRDSSFTHTNVDKETLSGTRGGTLSGVSIHSIRMPGVMASHKVILGTQGQTLSLGHDTISRECYMPGVVLAIREVVKGNGFVVGLEKLLGL